MQHKGDVQPSGQPLINVHHRQVWTGMDRYRQVWIGMGRMLICVLCCALKNWERRGRDHLHQQHSGTVAVKQVWSAVQPRKR